MNAYTLLYSDVCTGVVHLIFLCDNKRVSAGTGFMVRGRLFTNNHVIQCPGADSVLIRTLRHDRHDISDGFMIPYSEFMESLRAGSPENQFDYAILEIPKLADLSLYNFTIANNLAISIGREFAILGYPLDHYNLTVHRGIISSVFEQRGVEKLQLDGSVNNGNSGGPLVDVTNSQVVGIVTRKDTGLTRMFEKMKSSLNTHAENIEKLVASGAMISQSIVRPNPSGQGASYILGGHIELDNGLADTARALARLCLEIERSANTGIGYAFSIRHLAEDHPDLAFGA